uniref:Disease resistance R13L4/SHOC-2-like LRR domain-containing protein n=1 Tax=Triticum urartu TaxID=4572 RepID=A0A8R7QMS4_TRIUA
MCQVNGFFHEYIMSRPMEDNLFFSLEGHCSLNSQVVGQHLTIRNSWDRDINVFESIDFSSLRSLTVFGEWRPFFISTNINMRLVRVLDLEDTSNVTDDDLKDIGKLLPRLKFLSLRGRRGITHLPKSLSCLRQLQTLDVRHTSITALPQAIIKLQKLQYIRAGTSKQPWNEGGRVTSLPTLDGQLNSRGVEVPAGIGKLRALHTLGVVNVSGVGGKAIVMELKTLSQLRRLGLCGINRENLKELCSAISGHSHLEYLSVEVDKDK